MNTFSQCLIVLSLFGLSSQSTSWSKCLLCFCNYSFVCVCSEVSLFMILYCDYQCIDISFAFVSIFLFLFFIFLFIPVSCHWDKIFLNVFHLNFNVFPSVGIFIYYFCHSVGGWLTSTWHWQTVCHFPWNNALLRM